MQPDFTPYLSFGVADFMADASFRQWVMAGQMDTFWQAFGVAHPAQAAHMTEARLLLQTINEKYATVSADQLAASWADLQQRIADNSLPTVTPATIARRRMYRYLSVAAILLLGVLAIVLFWPSPNAPRLYATDYGEQLPITLPDGSRVWLNAHSTLENVQFTDDQRIVALRGEAYFSVPPDSTAPFRVLTDDLVLEVLGTAFNVNSHRSQTAVFLEEGSVKLDLEENSAQAVYLQPGEMLTYSIRSRQITDRHRVTQPDLHTSWREGVLKFKNTPLPDVLARLQDIYGIETRIASDELASYTLTSTGVPADALPLALSIIGTAMAIEFDQIAAGEYRVLPAKNQ